MITAEDMKFHKPTSNDPEWAETNYFPFHIEEEGIQVAAYVLARPNLGVVLADVFAYQGSNPSPTTSLYFDKKVHLPIQEKLEDYKLGLSSGFSVKAVNAPMDYEVDYVGYDDTEYHLYYKGLSEPYDIHDPKQDPITAAQQAKESDNSWGKGAYAGHFDQSAHVTGDAKILGKSYKVDCVTTMDHSWGPRAEMSIPNMSWFHAHFGPDLAIHCIAYVDPINTDKVGPVLHGYVVENGKLYGIAEGNGRTTRDHLLPTGIEMSVTDSRGKTFNLAGKSVSTYAWFAWPGINVQSALLKWECDGVSGTGMGETQDCFSMKYVCQANKAFANKAA